MTTGAARVQPEREAGGGPGRAPSGGALRAGPGLPAVRKGREGLLSAPLPGWQQRVRYFP